MKLIVALGNPEPKYSWTRHNVGKDVLNLFVNSEIGLSKIDAWQKFAGDISYLEMGKNKIVKPKSFMNVIGEPVSLFAEFYKIDPKNMLVIYDELDMVIGTFKITEGRGSKIHNGIKSIEQYIDSKQFWHLRIGVREPEIEMSVQKAGKDPSRYVPQKLPLAHRNQIVKLYEVSLNKALNDWLSKD